MAKKKTETAAAAEGETVVTAGTVSGEQVAAAAEQRESTPKDSRNGVTRPNPASKTGQVWVIADSLSAKKGAPAERKEVLEACKNAGIVDATAQTQFGRWKKYHGLVTPRAQAEAAPAVVAAPEVPAVPAPPAQ